MAPELDGRYTTVVGLEIHAELLTKTKLFCGCSNAFGSGENENVCPGCLALPGALPALNRAAVELAIRAGLALGCGISELTRWDKKSYFYADLPAGFQITQMYAPICTGGGLDIGERFVRLDHIHLEEDAGKLIHDSLRNTTRIDFNRAGVPLIEIVTKPDMRSAEEAARFIEKVRLALIYAGVCDGRMEQGRLRVDANISVMPEGAAEFGTKVEVKNLNSIRFAAMAIGQETRRQIRILEEGGRIRQETRRFVEGAGETAAMREKEDAIDYRYFPDADIPPLKIDSGYIEALRASMPEPPESRKARYTGAHMMSASDADTILARKEIADFYDGMLVLGADSRGALSMVRGEILRRLSERGPGTAPPGGRTNRQADDPESYPTDRQADLRTGGQIASPAGGQDNTVGITPADAVRLLRMNAAGEINANNMKKAVGILMLNDGRRLDEILGEHDMLIREDPEALAAVVRGVLQANPAAVASYKAGEAKVLGFFMGMCNKTLKGAVQPKTLQDELRAQLDKL